MKSLTVLTVSLLNEDLVTLLIKSFEKFKPKELHVNYVVVENSDETSYRDRICSLTPNVTWIQNPIQKELVAGASWAHGIGLNKGIQEVKDEWVFICDSDTMVSDFSFFSEMLDKINENFSLVGTSYDPTRINAIHPTGLLVKSQIAKSVDLQPCESENLDTANRITQYVRENNLTYYAFRNTWNDSSYINIINEPYKTWGDCGVDRCLNSNGDVMFLHLGRGTAKSGDLHWKNHRIFDAKAGYDRWLSFGKQLTHDKNIL